MFAKKGCLALSGVVLFLTFVSASYAQHEALKPLLVDLSGWEADAAQSMSLDLGGTKMITAVRAYTKGDHELTATVILGNETITQGKIEEMKVETADGNVSVSEMDGFQVQRLFDRNEKSGGIIVILQHGEGRGFLFTLTFDGIGEKEALELAKKFDWKKMKSEANRVF